MLNHSVVTARVVSINEAIAFRIFDAWEYAKAINWSDVGLKILKGYLLTIALIMFVALHLGLLAYAAGKWVWENREAIASAVKEAWDRLEPSFEESDMALYIYAHSDITLAPLEEFAASLDACEQDTPLGQIEGIIPAYQLA